MDADIQTAITVLRHRIKSKEEDVIRLKRTVNEMCADAGEDPPFPNISSSDTNGDISSLRADQFYGHTISGAAKAYLEMRHSARLGAASVNDIYGALKKGGFKFEAKDDENAKNGLRISLRKNSSIFHRLPAGDYGLLTWYPNAKPPKPDDDDDSAKAEKAPEKAPARKTEQKPKNKIKAPSIARVAPAPPPSAAVAPPVPQNGAPPEGSE